MTTYTVLQDRTRAAITTFAHRDLAEALALTLTALWPGEQFRVVAVAGPVHH